MQLEMQYSHYLVISLVERIKPHKLCIFNTNDDFDNKHNFFIDKKIVKKGIYVRNWKHGDKLIDENLNISKRLSDLFINNKISRFHKLFYPIIVDSDDNPICIPNLWYNNYFNNLNNSNMILKWQQN